MAPTSAASAASAASGRPPVRSMVVWCRDWPVVSVGARSDEPAAVVSANRVVACSPAARQEGVRKGQRRRDAQGRCPELVVFERDLSREARRFEPVVQAVEAFTPRIELTRPGSCTFPTLGPSRYFGGDRALAEQVQDRIDDVLDAAGWRGSGCVGVADGPFVAGLAARLVSGSASGPGPGPGGGRGPVITIVAPGESPSFLAPLPVGVLDDADLADVLVRLGLGTLGDLAGLDAADVVARFGPGGLHAYRLARGLDERLPDTRPPPPDMAVAVELDPPAERIDIAAFAAKALADELFDALEHRGLSCTRILIGAETDHGESVERLWRHEGALTAGAMTDRVRWQLEGWLHATHASAGSPTAPTAPSAPSAPSAGITLLRLVPDEVVPAHGRQLGFWGGESDADIRAVRALARVQGLLGPDAVLVPEWCGGRGPGEQLSLVPAATVDLTTVRPGARRSWVTAPWPGRLPSPAPAVVWPTPIPVEVTDAGGQAVTVDGRALVSAPVARLVFDGRDGGAGQAVAAWAGPWPADERWWDPAAHRRRARFQVLLADGVAHLLVVEGGRWWLEATYD